MKRSIEKQLVKWKDSKFRKPLLINGARQVGKTYVVESLFGPKNFSKILKIDFRSDSQSRKFVKNHPDARAIINYLDLRFGISIDSSTLLFFDEIQEAVQILTAAKYFKQDCPQIPVIMTGSLVRTRLKQLEAENESNRISLDPEIEKENQDGHNNFLFPVGMLDEMNMYPMTFDEFLVEYKPSLYKLVLDSYISKKSLDQSYHKLALDAFYIYLQVGGMPEAVAVFLNSQSVVQSQKTIQTIFNDYLADMGLYQVSSQTISRTRMVFNNIYEQLDKENKNFKIAVIEKGKRFRDYLSAFDWLTLTRLIYKSELVKERLSLPLKSESNSLFRIYLPDCGLFTYEARINLSVFVSSLNQNTLAGILMENYVAEELSARDVPLFHWKGKSSSEFEFIVNEDDYTVPIDVKKNRGSLDSLNVFKRFNPYKYSIKVSQNRYGFSEENKILTLPFYLFPFYLNEMLEKGHIQSISN